MMNEFKHSAREIQGQVAQSKYYVQGEDIRDIHGILKAAEFAKKHFSKQLERAAREHGHHESGAIEDFRRGRLVSWFRGHASSKWRLLPGVLRGTHNEKALIQQFLRQAPSRKDKCPRDNDLAGWISLMQHHGLPTRLLDWTQSILVAAFFAVGYEENRGDAALWALAPALLNHAYRHDPSYFLLAGPATEAVLCSAFGVCNNPMPDEILAVLPPEVDLRLLLQRSAFTLHASGVALDHSKSPGSYLIKFRIPANAKTRLAEQLKCLGICSSSLFPDLGHLADDVANRPPKKAR